MTVCMRRDIHTTTLYYWFHTTGMPHLKIDNYIFRTLLAIFRLSSRELMVLLYILCANVMERSLYPDFIA